MAGDWIKVEVATVDKPEVMRIARACGISRDAAFGKLVRLWAWFDSNSVDGAVDGVVDGDVDDLCQQGGFAVAVAAVGWLRIEEACQRMTLPNFDRHNGETAKQRALNARRQRKWRAGVDAPVDGKASTSALPRERVREEVKAKATVQQAAPQVEVPDSLPGDIRLPDGPAPRKPKQTAVRFPEFWAAYPVKKGRAAAERHWRSQGLDPMADQIIAHVRLMEAEDDQWQRGFIKHGSAYINGKGWEDEPVKPPLDRNAKAHAPPPPPESFGSKAALQRSESKLENALAYIRQQHGRGEFGEGEAGTAEFNRRMAEATAKYRNQGSGDEK